MLINRHNSFFSVIKERKSIVILLILVITTWITHFLYHLEFGLYEDDWGRIALSMSMTFSDLGEFIIHNFTDLRFSQGRPLHPTLIVVLSSIATKLGGLKVAYWLGAIILSTNAFLFYILLRCLFESYGFALLGSLLFSLFPADTTQPFLTHSLGIQPSLTILLIAIHCYLAHRIKLSYGIIFLSLLCYETAFPVFLVAPLLQEEWSRKNIKNFYKHALVLAVMIIFVAIIRGFIGERNIAKPNFYTNLLFISNPIVGPITAMIMFVYRPMSVLFTLPKEYYGVLILCFCGLGWILSQGDFCRSLSISGGGKSLVGLTWLPSKITENLGGFTKAVLIGLMMLVLAYPLTLTTLGFSVSGRGTRVHSVAVFGASILLASLLLMLVGVAKKYGRQRLAIWGLAAYLTLLIGFGLTVQYDYKTSWSHQRAFWTDAIALMPDITDGTVIFLEPTGLRDTRQLLFLRKDLTGIPDTRQIKFLDVLYLILPSIYNFPQHWQYPPRIYRLPKNWQEIIISQDGLLQTVSTEEEWSGIVEGVPRRSVKSSDVIFLETKNGKLTRRKEPLVLGEKIFKLKEQSVSGLPTFEKTPIYDYLIRQPTEPRVSYLL